MNDLTVKVNEEFAVTLESNATTGYEWQLAKPLDGKIIDLISHDYIPDEPPPGAEPGITGIGGVEVWKFKALQKDKTRIFFKYVRPWEKDVPPVETAEYEVRIK